MLYEGIQSRLCAYSCEDDRNLLAYLDGHSLVAQMVAQSADYRITESDQQFCYIGREARVSKPIQKLGHQAAFLHFPTEKMASRATSTSASASSCASNG